MIDRGIKYLRGTIIRVEYESDIFFDLLILNDVHYNSDDIICMKINKKLNKLLDNNIIIIPNGEYNRLNNYIHTTIIDSMIQKIREKDYTHNEESILGKEKLIHSLSYIIR